jgi:hypothetical protein
MKNIGQRSVMIAKSVSYHVDSGEFDKTLAVIEANLASTYNASAGRFGYLILSNRLASNLTLIWICESDSTTQGFEPIVNPVWTKVDDLAGTKDFDVVALRAPGKRTTRTADHEGGRGDIEHYIGLLLRQRGHDVR